MQLWSHEICVPWYHHTCIGLTERYVTRYHHQALLDSGLRSFANFLLHYDLSFNDRKLDLVGQVHLTLKALPQEHKDYASLNIFLCAHKARNRVYPGCVSIKGLQNPKSVGSTRSCKLFVVAVSLIFLVIWLQN